MKGMQLGVLAGVVGCLGGLATAGVSASAGSAGTRHTGGAIHYVMPRGVSGTAPVAAPAASNNLVYNGGPVEASSSTNYAIFWEPPLYSVSAQYNSLISRFLSDIGGSGLYGVATQYYQVVGGTQQNIANSSSLGGVFVDTAAYPAPVLQDSDIQNEVTKVMAAKGWTGGIGHEFFVFTSKNEISCSGAVCSNTYFCAYHSSFVSAGTTILYANQPYANTLPTGCNTPTSPNNDSDADSTINVTSHELMETVTDPAVGASNYAWIDSSGSEIGDKCNFNFGPTDASGADLRANGHGYIVQQEWSNRVSGCSMS
ncbi:MAG TPA: hypothetical protein VG266_10715 [Candidatus Dormibacteraeota bacterium]|nr:hypothetical protein [Candidatus Dormibacteraeota bacterium]